MGESKQIIINGKEYSVVNPGVRWMLKHTDMCTNKNGVVSNERYMEGLIEYCVSPKIKLDDFTSMAQLQEVAKAIEDFHGEVKA